MKSQNFKIHYVVATAGTTRSRRRGGLPPRLLATKAFGGQGFWPPRLGREGDSMLIGTGIAMSVFDVNESGYVLF